MAGDLESLYEHYRNRGLEDEEALRRAEERVVASPEVLHNLILLHSTGYQRWSSLAAGGLRYGFDLLLLIGGVVPLAAFTVTVVAAQLREARGGVLLWMVALLALGVAGIGVWKAFELLVRGERSPERLHRGVSHLLVLGAAGVLLGGAGFLVSGYRAALLMGVGSVDAALLVAEAIVASGTVFALGILLAIAAGLIWFVLVNRIGRIEQEESAALLAT